MTFKASGCGQFDEFYLLDRTVLVLTCTWRASCGRPVACPRTLCVPSEKMVAVNLKFTKRMVTVSLILMKKVKTMVIKMMLIMKTW